MALWKHVESTRRHCKSGLCQQGRPYCGAATSRESAKEHQAGAPAAARDAIATRIGTLKQAVYTKEPVHVQLVKVQATLTRAEEFAEKKPSADWAAREAADMADQHVLNLRQRKAELAERVLHGRGRAHDRRTVGLLESGTVLMFLGLVGSGINRAMVCRRNVRPSMVERRQPLEWKWRISQVCCVWAAARTVRRPSGSLAAVDGRAEKHGCGSNGFAAGSCVDDACDACDAEHVQTGSRTAGDSVGACHAKRILQEGGRAESG